MNYKHYIDRDENRLAKYNLLKFSVMCLGAAFLVQSVFIWKAARNVQTILIPDIAATPGYTIENDDADLAYVKDYTSSRILYYALNYTPATYIGQLNSLLQHCTARFYPAMEKKLMDEKDKIKRLSMTSSYFPHTMTVNQKDRTIHVKGLRVKHAAGTEIKRGMEEYSISYHILDGRYFLNDFQQINN